MPQAGASSERMLILAPRGRDSAVAGAILTEARLSFQVCAGLESLVDELQRGAGVAVVTNESLSTADLKGLSTWIAGQPPWSDMPFVVLTERGGGLERNPLARRLTLLLGNASFVERPFHPTTLVSMAQTALRGRRRQYQARALLEDLRLANEQLESRVLDRTRDLEGANLRLQEEMAERAKAEESLRQSQKVEIIGQITGGVAHDFNNLLMAVMGNLELLRKHLPDDDPRVERLLSGAQQGAQRGAALTQRLLAFARRQDLHTTSVDVGGLLSGIRQLLERSVGPLVEVQMRVLPGLSPAEADPNQLELALLNLVVNARDAMPQGGVIVIEANETDFPGDDQLAPGRYLRLTVKDSGAGMDKKTLARAVEPFFSTKPPGKGTGLGLSMVHGLAAQSGGAMTLSSEPGQGVTVELLLPLATNQPAAPAADLGAAPPAAAPAVILIVDDEPLISMNTCDMLEDLGHTVVQAGSGAEALEILQRDSRIAAMVTDHAMPGMTGLELARRARTLRPGLPVLLATGYADLAPGEEIELPRLGKPYGQDQLAAHIAHLLADA